MPEGSAQSQCCSTRCGDQALPRPPRPEGGDHVSQVDRQSNTQSRARTRDIGYWDIIRVRGNSMSHVRVMPSGRPCGRCSRIFSSFCIILARLNEDLLFSSPSCVNSLGTTRGAADWSPLGAVCLPVLSHGWCSGRVCREKTDCNTLLRRQLTDENLIMPKVSH